MYNISLNPHALYVAEYAERVRCSFDSIILRACGVSISDSPESVDSDSETASRIASSGVE